jgi:NADH-quinone oxidoreductase subunit J
VTGVAMLTSRSAIYSALFLVLNLCCIAVFFLILGGQFIAVVQVSVYAGAIMVLFLFVIMLLGAEHTPGKQHLPWQPAVAVVLALVLLGMTGYTVWRAASGDSLSAAPKLWQPKYRQAVQQLSLAFEVTSVLLLVAMVGAVVMTRTRNEPGRLCTVLPYIWVERCVILMGVIGVLVRRNAIIILIGR